jgi:hypothetical protein
MYKLNNLMRTYHDGQRYEIDDVPPNQVGMSDALERMHARLNQLEMMRQKQSSVTPQDWSGLFYVSPVGSGAFEVRVNYTELLKVGLLCGLTFVVLNAIVSIAMSHAQEK